MEPNSQKVSRVAFAYLWSILFWMGLASLVTGEDKVHFWERGLHTSARNALEPQRGIFNNFSAVFPSEA